MKKILITALLLLIELSSFSQVDEISLLKKEYEYIEAEFVDFSMGDFAHYTFKTKNGEEYDFNSIEDVSFDEEADHAGKSFHIFYKSEEFVDPYNGPYTAEIIYRIIETEAIEEEIYNTVDTYPSHPSQSTFSLEIGKKIKEKFPDHMGNIYLVVVINKNGTTEVESIARGLSEESDKYAVQLFNEYFEENRWSAGIKDGNLVRTRLNIIIKLPIM